MPSGKSSPKKSPKGGKASPNKGNRMTAEELAELERKVFARKRYETMGAVFTQKSKLISLYVQSIHLYEIWNRLPPYEQFCNSNVEDTNESNKGSPKSKSSPKKSPKKGGKVDGQEKGDEPPKSEYEPALLSGVICVHKSLISGDKKLYIEVTSNFKYFAHTRVPPFPDNVTSNCQCFRDVQLIYPVNFDMDTQLPDFIQQLIFKLRQTVGRGYRFLPFVFDVTRKPDSLFFTRPFYSDYSSGLFWNMRAYVALEEYCTPSPEEQISMEFFKYTITPALTPSTSRTTPPAKYTRFSTMDDTGDLILQAQLERDIYYQGQEIKVKINVENNSNRHVVYSIAVFVEQTYRLFHQFPHDSSITLGENVLNAGENGLPINPRQKNWMKDVVVKPVYDPTKYNLAIDGKMPVDNKLFLANSTVIMLGKLVINVVEDESEEAKPSPKASPKGKKGSPKDTASPKKGSPKNKSPPKGKSPEKASGKRSPSPKSATAPGVEEPPPEPKPSVIRTEVNTLTNKQVCRSATISYDVVVRLNLRTPNGDEAGHPMVRLPFILTRETRYLDKLANPPPPTWTVVKPH